MSITNEITDEQLVEFQRKFGARYERGRAGDFHFAFPVTHELTGPGAHHWAYVGADNNGSHIVNWYVRDSSGRIIIHGAEWSGTRYENLKSALSWIHAYGAKRVKPRVSIHSN